VKNRETRTFVQELRTVDTDNGPVIEGYAAMFNTRSEDLGGFVEYIRPSAFTKTLKENPDIRALWAHDDSLVIGRTKSGTLEINEDEVGLKVRIQPPDTAQTRYFVESIRRGDVDGMSFGFRVLRDEWSQEEDGTARRDLLEVQLFEVSPVAFPAYPATEGNLNVRSYLEKIGEREERIEQIVQKIETSGAAPIRADHPEPEADHDDTPVAERDHLSEDRQYDVEEAERRLRLYQFT
jgi:HK97 family phage prohead protease